jgi:hypothetical protein
MFELFVFGAFGVLMFICFGLLAWLLTRAHRDKSPEGQARLRREAEAWLEQKADGLMPWGPTSLSNISDGFKLSFLPGSRLLHGCIR